MPTLLFSRTLTNLFWDTFATSGNKLLVSGLLEKQDRPVEDDEQQEEGGEDGPGVSVDLLPEDLLPARGVVPPRGLQKSLTTHPQHRASTSRRLRMCRRRRRRGLNVPRGQTRRLLGGLDALQKTRKLH